MRKSSKARFTQAVGQPQPDLGRLADLEPVRRLQGRNVTKATILFYRVDGVGIVLKTYQDHPVLVRWTLGRYLVAREAAAFRAAAGVEGVPALLGRPRPWALATEWVEGRTLAELKGTVVPPGVFDRLQRLIDQLHDHGVALWDLHHRDVLVTDDGTVHVVDLATARTVDERAGRLGRFLFDRARDQDRVAVARMRARCRGGDLDRAVAAVGRSAQRWHRLGRRLKGGLDRVRGKRRSDGRRGQAGPGGQEGTT